MKCLVEGGGKNNTLKAENRGSVSGFEFYHVCTAVCENSVSRLRFDLSLPKPLHPALRCTCETVNTDEKEAGWLTRYIYFYGSNSEGAGAREDQIRESGWSHETHGITYHGWLLSPYRRH